MLWMATAGLFEAESEITETPIEPALQQIGYQELLTKMQEVLYEEFLDEIFGYHTMKEKDDWLSDVYSDQYYIVDPVQIRKKVYPDLEHLF